MKTIKLFFLFLFIAEIASAQVPDNGTPSLKSQSDAIKFETRAGHVTNVIEANMFESFISGKMSRVEALTTSGTNTYTAAVSWLTSYSIPFWLPIQFGNINSGSSTLNINGFGDKTIVKDKVGTPLTGGELLGAAWLYYDGTNFELASGSGGEQTSNKAIDFSVVNNTLYPSVQAVENRISSVVSNATSWKTSCVAATTTSITLLGAQTIDGVACSVGDRVLVKNQSTASQNGIFTVQVFSWTRDSDAATSSQLESATVQIQSGGQANTTWTQTADNITVGTTSLTWVQQYPSASSSQAGTVKLYTTTGINTDGTMDQNSISSLVASSASWGSIPGNITDQNDLQLELKWKVDCKAATTANITLSGNQTIDGISVTSNDRVLVKNQTSHQDDGIYLVGTPWVRSPDATQSFHLERAVVQIRLGTQANTVWLQDVYGVFVGTTPLSWVQQYPNATSSTSGISKLYTGTGSNTDGAMDQNSASNSFLKVANNLSDVTASTARTNLGLTSLATTTPGAGWVSPLGIALGSGWDAAFAATYSAGGGGTTTNALSIAAELISGGASSFNGSVAKSIAIQSTSVTNAMLAGGIDVTSKITGIVPNANGGAGSLTGLLKAASGIVSAATPRTDYTGSYPTVSSTASTASLTPDPTINDEYIITALAVGLTINNPSVNGSGYSFMISIKDNATPQTLTWDTQYRGVGGALPSTTTSSTTIYFPCIYNSADSKWDVSVSGISGTTNQIAYFSGATTIGSLTTATYPSLAELATVKGSNTGTTLQAQINALSGSTSYLLASGGAASASNTFSSTTPSGWNFTNAFTATANNQYGLKMTFTETSENVNNDVFEGFVADGTLTGNAGGPTGQTANFFRLNPTFAGGTATVNILKMQLAGTDIYTFASGGSAFTKSSNAVFNLNMTNATSGTASRVGLLLNSSTVGGSLYVTSATFTNSGINELNTMVLQNTGNINIGSTGGSNSVSVWTAGIKRLAIDVGGNIAITQGAQVASWAPGLSLTFANHTAMAASTEYPNFTTSNATQTAASGTTAIQRNAYIKRITYAGTSGTRTITDPYGLYVEDNAAGTNGALTNNYAIGADGSIALVTAGNMIFVKEGSNAMTGKTTLVSGTKGITVTGVTTSDHCWANVYSASGASLTANYQCVCTANTITVQANVVGQTINTADGSSVDYVVLRVKP